MGQENTRSNKHLNRDDRRQIETLLNEGHSFRYIAERLDRPVSTISREVGRHTKIIQPSGCEDCTYYHRCNKTRVCQYGRNNGCRRQCRKCTGARKSCSDFVQGYCQKLMDDRTGVCNFCRNRNGRTCSYERRLYVSSEAHTAYKKDWSEKRAGFDLTDEQITHISDIVTPLIRKGQSPYHIIQTHGSELGISEATLRRLVGDSKLDARNIDLRCLVKMKPRRKNTNNGYRVMVVVKDGHKWEDFKRFIADTGSPYAEMDCVEGAKESHSVLLTLLFPVSSLQEAIIMREHDAMHVVDALDMLEEVLGEDLFHECFPVLLTDNGHEFADLYRMEHGSDGHERTKVFYCEPNRSDQKGHCENNHKYIRYVIPKGTNMDGLCQSDIALMMDHINSYKRKHLHGRTPYQAGKLFLSEDFFDLLGIEEVAPDDVNLTPGLIFPGGKVPKGNTSD